MINEFVEPGHFYSVIPNIRADYNKREPTFINLDFGDNKHSEVLNDINNYLTEFDSQFGYNQNVTERQNIFQYSLMNGNYGWMDARLLHYFLQKKQTQKNN